MLLALLALIMNLAAPPGFMLAPRGAGLGIVICTGHGPETLAAQPASPDHKPAKPVHDGVCAFAGHGLASAPPPLAVIARMARAFSIAREESFSDLAPGRGLAAPPPPSQGPPILM